MGQQKKQPQALAKERRREAVPPSHYRPYPVATEHGEAAAEIWPYVGHRHFEYAFLCLVCERTHRQPPGEQIEFRIMKRHCGDIGDVCLPCLLGGPGVAFDRVHARLMQPTPRIPTAAHTGPV